MQKLQYPVSSEGWSIQIYGSDRRLLLSLDATHAWLLGIGIVLGFAIALVGLRDQCQASQTPVESPHLVAPLELE
ncbi:hypothetical protein K4A83_00935 [Spirulina subsalsa FACHB-351]|uniref:Uncharacterized protein n=1 Tax=Spirulina subsalsa FACHB-351 TaxID=234711 RepID=A0ABT3L018_9CYAN|nr:hypothetical protein [Spirulina subsalsa]MCW6034843.1 hypothetical protein [Spirulina subsalsa FACHB-351]